MFIPQKAVERSCGIEREANDPAAVVDVVGERCGTARRIDRRVRHPGPAGTRGTFPPASTYSPTIWPRLLMPKGWVRTAPGTSIFVKTPLSSRNPWGRSRAGTLGSSAVGADDLALRVDPRREGRLGAGEIDHGEGLFVLQETMESSSVIDVAAHCPAALIDAEDHGVEAGVRGIDGGEDAVARHESMALDTDVVLVFAGSHSCRPDAESSAGDAVGCSAAHAARTGHRERCKNYRGDDGRDHTTMEPCAVCENHIHLLL